MDTAFSRAIARREALAREIDRLDAFIAMYKELSEAAPVVRVGEPERRSPEGKVAAGVMRIADAAMSALEKADHPLSRAELLQAMEAAGVTVGGKDPAATLGTAMWRDRRFENIKGRGYWIAGRPLTAADEAAPNAEASRPASIFD